MIIKGLAKAYCILFYKPYCFFRFTAEEGWEHWKALIAINTLCILLLVEVIVWTDVIFKFRFGGGDNTLLTALLISVPASYINYRIFVYKKRWQGYVKEFEKYPKKKSVTYSWLAFCFVIGVISSLIFAFYQLSLINWGNYS